MRSHRALWIVAAVCMALFGICAALLLRLLPGPRQPFDYMIVGTFATSVSLLGLFLGLTFRARNVFFRRRVARKDGPPS